MSDPDSSFTMDIEKFPHDYPEEKKKESNPKRDKKRSNIVVRALMVCFVMYFLVSMVFVTLENPPTSINDAKLISSQENTIIDGKVVQTDIDLLDVTTVNANNEFEKLNSDKNPKNSKSKSGESKHKLLHETHDLVKISDVDPQADLKEILSVSPIIILSNNEDAKKQSQLEEILLLKLTIVPEPKVIDLLKHPRQTDILNYLKQYSTHEKTTTTTPTGVNENLDYDHFLHLMTDEENEEDEIPRLFIGGEPMGSYKDIFEKFKDNSLIGYLRDKGHGLISVS